MNLARPAGQHCGGWTFRTSSVTFAGRVLCHFPSQARNAPLPWAGSRANATLDWRRESISPKTAKNQFNCADALSACGQARGAGARGADALPNRTPWPAVPRSRGAIPFFSPLQWPGNTCMKNPPFRRKPPACGHAALAIPSGASAGG